MMKPSLRVLAFTALATGFASLAPACAGKAGDYCDVYCECERCNDRAEDLCHADTSAFLDEADIYGCSSQGEALIDCVITNGNCLDANYNPMTSGQDRCSVDQINYQLCVATSSGFLAQQSGGPPPGGGGAPSPEPATLPGVDWRDDVEVE